MIAATCASKWRRLGKSIACTRTQDGARILHMQRLLNRAVVVAMARGPAAGLALAGALCDSPALRNDHLLPSTRDDFLFKLDRPGTRLCVSAIKPQSGPRCRGPTP
jgi:hypothetical protein